jgi:hypothetical protein
MASMSGSGIVSAWIAIILWSAMNGVFLILDSRVRIEEKNVLWPILIKLAIFTLSLWPFIVSIRQHNS